MGRPEIAVDTDVLYDLVETGASQKEIASDLGIAQATLSKRMAKIKNKQGLLLQYRTLQSLQLTSLQAEILERITPDKIDSAPLRDLVYAFKVLKDKELITDGKPSEIKGLVAYLVEMEKRDAIQEGEIETVVTDEEKEEKEDVLPKL